MKKSLKQQIDEQFDDIMNCKDWKAIVDPFPVAAKLLGEEAGLDKETWLKMAIVHQHKELNKLRKELGVNASGIKVKYD